MTPMEKESKEVELTQMEEIQENLEQMVERFRREEIERIQKETADMMRQAVEILKTALEQITANLSEIFAVISEEATETPPTKMTSRYLVKSYKETLMEARQTGKMKRRMTLPMTVCRMKRRTIYQGGRRNRKRNPGTKEE